MQQFGHYAAYKPNPLVQIFYLTLVVGGYIVFLYSANHLMILCPTLGWYHEYTAHMGVMVTVYTFLLASMANAGRVTPGNAAIIEKSFEYDGFLYVKKDCRTCKTVKPARSKHCAICNR